MNDDINNLKQTIKAQRAKIAKLEGEIKDAPTFKLNEKLRSELTHAKFDLTQITKELVATEKAEAEQAFQVAVAAYQKKHTEYSTKLDELDKLEVDTIAALVALNDLFSNHYKLCLNLWERNSGLRHEAARLNLPEPVYPKFNSGNADKCIHDLVARSGSNGYISKLLRLAFQPIIMGGWIQRGN